MSILWPGEVGVLADTMTRDLAPAKFHTLVISSAFHFGFGILRVPTESSQLAFKHLDWNGGGGGEGCP